MAMTSEALRVVVLKESDTWVAQCLEYDVQAQGSTFQCAMRRLRAAVASDSEYTKSKHGERMHGIEPAPQMYHDLFESAAEPFQSGDVELRIAA